MIFQMCHLSRMTPFQMKGFCCCSCYSVWTKRWLSSILSIIFKEWKKKISKLERTKATLQSLQQRRKCFLAKIIPSCQWNLCQAVPLLPWLLQLKTGGKENPWENERSRVPAKSPECPLWLCDKLSVTGAQQHLELPWRGLNPLEIREVVCSLTKELLERILKE